MICMYTGQKDGMVSNIGRLVEIALRIYGRFFRSDICRCLCSQHVAHVLLSSAIFKTQDATRCPRELRNAVGHVRAHICRAST